MRIYPYTHIGVCSLVFMSWLIVFLLLAGYCSKEKLDSTKNLTTTSNMKTSPYAVASVYELDRKYVLIDINGLSFSNGTFMRSGDVFISYHTTSVATALECVQNKFNTRASYFSRIDKETRFVNSVLNSNPHMMFLLWLTPSIKKFFSGTFPFIIHTTRLHVKKFLWRGVAFSDSGLTRMQILMNLICL